MLPPSLKAIGRRRVQFHLDDLVRIGKDPITEEYFWVCLMAEPNLRDSLQNLAGQVGVACGVYATGYLTQQLTEERALSHLVNYHRAQGGDRLPRGRGRERRAKRIEEWNDRRRQEKETRSNVVHTG